MTFNSINQFASRVMRNFWFYDKIAVIILLLGLFTGCSEEIRQGINFYHYLHVDEYEIDCIFCHGEMNKGMFAQADMDVCVECHEEEVEADEISTETCGKCHLDQNLEEIEVPDYERATRGVFRHSEALSDACRKCHVETVKDTSEEPALWSRADVVEIRNRAHLFRFDCKTCHKNINKNSMWEKQQKSGRKDHGNFNLADRPLCILCHEEIYGKRIRQEILK